MTTFDSLGLDPRILATLGELGYEEPTPIQSQTIPLLLEGNDLMGQAATGTGKTAAFSLPIVQRLLTEGRGETPVALVLVPTRELAVQVSEAMYRYGRSIGARVLSVYGGQSIVRQMRTLDRGVDIVVATPGRAIDHLRRGTLDLSNVATVVLDEADEMLDMGFIDDIETILSEAPAERQTVLFSATMPPRITSLTKRHLKDPKKIEVGRETLAPGETPKIRQTAYVVPRAHKTAALGRLLDLESPTAAIVFCRTRNEVDQLSDTLVARGYRAEPLHGGMTQEQRDRVMQRLRSGTAELLVATDVAARGLDVEHLSHVINYDVPSAAESYVHRIGRVGRAGREGVAITLVEPREHRMLRSIERVTRRPIEVEQVPTVADLRARRLELTRAAVREAALQDDADGYRVVVEALAEEFDVMEIAMAAVKLVHEAAGGDPDEEEREIPKAVLGHERSSGRSGRRNDRGDRGARSGKHGGKRHRHKLDGGVVVLRIGAGRHAGIRPQDLVGAITNEAGIRGGNIGAIEIADRYSLVEVAEGVASDVTRALRATMLRGNKVSVNQERDR